ncbi:hypothetical protein RD110_03200 [Rhodoferax koreense]|uniref:Uncharacterized protein n=1 Tax=Rhodoferax koreensis TaxID=1842727 RepID=A0A1P8JRH9_9BURK|nr:hypothetical protein RD110_03200 [Rhodoferax koreense]
MREWGLHTKHNQAKRAGDARVEHPLPFHGDLLVVEEQIAQQSRDMHRISTDSSAIWVTRVVLRERA